MYDLSKSLRSFRNCSLFVSGVLKFHGDGPQVCLFDWLVDSVYCVFQSKNLWPLVLENCLQLFLDDFLPIVLPVFFFLELLLCECWILQIVLFPFLVKFLNT